MKSFANRVEYDLAVCCYPMKKLYTHENRLIIYNLKNLLQKAGIESQVTNEYASGAVGDLAAFETWPELWVPDSQQFDQAVSILNQILSLRTGPEWFCRGCQEKNDASFELCWNCGRPIE